MSAASSTYPILDIQSVPPLIAGLDHVRALLGGGACDWRVREVGDGNLNLVFLVDGPEGSVCLKQALPYVRVAGPGWPLSPERAHFENAYFRSVAPYVGTLIPAVHHYDAVRHFTIMERLSPHIILRHGLIAGRRYPHVGRDIGEFVARACFYTSDLAGPFERKLDGVALFAGNKPLIRITVDLIFAEPYFNAERNRHTSPELDEAASGLRRDANLKVRAARFGQKFLTETQALLHGDLHSGSVMVTETDTRVIDPEFAFYGPIGFDLGAFFGNLLLSWYSQFGRETADDDRSAHRAWILDQVNVFWTTFRHRFLSLWAGSASGDAFPGAMFAEATDAAALDSARNAFVDTLFDDMLGFGACKMIRRILGFAHVLDLEGIENVGMRAACESAALDMAATLLRHPEHFKTIADVAEAVPRLQPRRRRSP
jgi:5-methylthioribose kinase